MAKSGGRIVCARCGANNFDTVTVCWKCSAPLGGAAPASTGVQSAPTMGAPQASSYSEPFSPRVPITGGMTMNPQTANRAAFWLGLLMPYFGLPIALAFMMCDDPRRQEVGRICLLWSVISGVIHILLMFVLMLGMQAALMSLIGGLKGVQPGGGGGGGGGME